MANMSGSEFAARWVAQLSQSAADGRIEKGIMSITEAPSAAAIRQKAKLVQNWNAAITDGSWERALGAVTASDWQDAMRKKALPIIASRAQESAVKMAAFGDKLLAYQNSQLPNIYKMPSTTAADSKNRMNAWFDVMVKFKAK